MKKIFKISALLLTLPLIFTSCFKLEQEDIFDDSAAERLNKMAAEYKTVLTDKGGKWQMEYFANEGMQGYVYVMTFRPDGTVTVAGENPYIGAVDKGNGSTELAYGTADSQWDLITDNGPVLSFSTYNKYFHVFSRPDDILNTSSGTGNDGRGFEGDYEFSILKYSGDTLYIKGKKHELNMIMTRLSPDTDDKTFLDEVVANGSKYFSTLIPRVFLTYPDGSRYVIQDGSGLIMNIYDETVEDPLTSSFSRNGIIGHDSFSFMSPLEHGGFNVQHFLPQEDGSLLCIDDNTSTISAGDLAKDCFTDSLHYMRPRSITPADAMKETPGNSTSRTTYWEIVTNQCTGAVKDAIDKLNSQLPKRGTFKQNVSSIKFNYAGWPLQRYEMLVDIKISQQTTQTMKFYYEPEFTGENQMRMKFIEHDGVANTVAYYTNDSFSGLREIVEAVMGPTFKLSAVSLLAPDRITFTADNGVMMVQAKRW